MFSAKDLIVKPISAADAKRIVRAIHYSGKTVNNSRVHLGIFRGDRCGGAMQFGPSLDKRKLVGLVRGTRWNEFIELNRMALADWLPRNSESRCLGVALRWLRKAYPWLRWVVSFADATQSRPIPVVIVNGGPPRTSLAERPRRKASTSWGRARRA